MPKFVKKVKGDDDIVVETTVPREIVQLRAEGFEEQKAKSSSSSNSSSSSSSSSR